MTTEQMDEDFSLAPPSATWCDSLDRRCWNCVFYSFKWFASETMNSGKCFGHHATLGTRYVDGNMVCPKWRLDHDS